MEPEHLREKRKIVSLRFKIYRNQQLRIPFADFPKEDNKQQMVLVENLQTQDEGVSLAVEKLQEFGFSKVKAVNALERHGESYILENLQIVERDYLAGKVENLPGYVVAALKNDYRPKITPFEAAKSLRKQHAKLQQQNREQAQTQLKHLKNDFDKQRLQAALNRMTVADQQDLEKHFRDTYAGNPIYQKWGKDGLTHPVIQSLFRAFASKALLPEAATEAEFAAYVAGLGQDLSVLRVASGLESC